MNLPGIRQFDLTGRAAIITGGSKGLGYAMAAGLASAGADVLLVSRNGAEAESSAELIRSAHDRRAHGFSADVTNPEQVDRMIEAAIGHFGRLDILINSAGINIRGPIESLSLDQFNQVMNTNVTATWLSVRAALPHLKKSPAGRIINIASALGLVGLAGRTPYTASKGAIVQMTRTLALELSSNNVTANAICPGPFLTEMNRSIADTEDGKKFVVGATALKRWARLEEIQGAAIFLASDAASYVTGSMLAVDGGWTAQ